MAAYVCLSLFLIPLPDLDCDGIHYQHWGEANFSYANSALDLSVLSPFQGLAGLVQPLGVWLNPAYIVPRLIPFWNPRVVGFLTEIALMSATIYLLGRANGLPRLLSVISAQATVMFLFPPIYWWSVDWTHLNFGLYYARLMGFAIPSALGTLFLTCFCYLGKLSYRKNIFCAICLPVLLVYSILCDPLYTAVFWVPIPFFLAGVFWGSETKSVLQWRILGGVASVVVSLALNLPGFYQGIMGYAARSAFPNELYVEVQQWDNLAGLFFQGGLGTAAVVVLMFSCLFVCQFGTSQQRGFCLSVLLFQWFIVMICVIYVCSGIRWSQPLPMYVETGAHMAYLVATLLALKVVKDQFVAWRRTKSKKGKDCWIEWLDKKWVACISIMVLPLSGTVWVLHVWNGKDAPGFERPQTIMPAMGFIKYLEEQIAVPNDGRFRGSAALLLCVPGGGVMDKCGVPGSKPFDKESVNRREFYGPTFSPDFNLTGLWKHKIPTLEDNNHLVTPPFHFLVSRALSRPQDFHSRNWSLISKANPRLMAALGARFLVTDQRFDDPSLLLRISGTNVHGISLQVYEIPGANIGDVSPSQTICSTNAAETLALMTSTNFNFKETAIVYDNQITGLTPADAGAFFFEQGGVRVKARSHGSCLLVLPVQFSNSLRIKQVNANSNKKPINLIRANLLETGILFDGDIDITIAHVFGPFRGVTGRLRDIEDCRRLGIKENGEIPYPPDYQPLANNQIHPLSDLESSIAPTKELQK